MSDATCSLCGGTRGVRDMFLDHYAYDQTIVSPICDDCRPDGYEGKFMHIVKYDSG